MARPTLPAAGQSNWASVLNDGINDVSDRVDANTFSIPEPVSATAYTLVLADSNKIKEFTAASAITVTVPTNATVALPIGTTIELVQTTSSAITVAPASGVTIRSLGTLVTGGAWASVQIRKRSANEWVLTGATT